jgi:hypothetical protein
VRRLLTWAVVSLGVAALARRLRRRSAPDALPAGGVDEAVEPVTDDDPAEELRRKLAESRDDEQETPAPPVSAPSTVAERRAEVHEHGRAALDEMQVPKDGEA